jgi:hypothetical protein
MNKRIKELAQLAVEDAAKYCQRPFDLSREENETFALSFAELIVRECCDIFVELRTRPADLAVLDVKKYFGIEE